MLANLAIGDRIVRTADDCRRPKAIREIPAKKKDGSDEKRYVARRLDRSKQAVYALKVFAIDDGTAPEKASSMITIKVTPGSGKPKGADVRK